MPSILKFIRGPKGIAIGLFLLVIIFVFFSIDSMLTTVELNGWEYFYGSLKIGDIIVGLGTVLLAVFTGLLAFTSSRDARRERRVMRIKEQLEGLYSPLMAYIKYFDNVDEHFSLSERKINAVRKAGETKVWLLMHEIRSKYEFLAEPELKRKLREYYIEKDTPPYDMVGSIIYNKGLEWRERLVHIKTLIENDYQKLTQEYEKLYSIP
ncbi:MAG: hypothetical protein ABSA11_15640 [Candidatus Bathyarchaeia archaeon]|jgi:hypothetical protein